jgi:hypothetical protein
MIYNNTSEESGKKKKREEKERIEIRKSPSFLYLGDPLSNSD